MTLIGLLASLALLASLVARETQRVQAPDVAVRHHDWIWFIDLPLWGLCAILVLPRLAELIT